MRTLLLLVILVTAFKGNVPYTSAQSLNRLFTTPTQRAQLDRIRIQSMEPGNRPGNEAAEPGPDVVEAELEQELEEAVPILPEAELVYSLGGAVIRSDGSINVWINGRLFDLESLPQNMELLSPFTQGQLRITDPRSRSVYLVKPGQTLNLTTGKLFETYQLTSGTIDPAPASTGQSTAPPGQP
ncbi:MAG: hypothetical protein WD772_03225 [Pseudohongiellaceae bacterium]